jgi:hypothetical protein
MHPAFNIHASCGILTLQNYRILRYNQSMSIERLQRAVSEKLIRLGPQAKEKLALEAECSVSTIRNVEAGQAPRRGTAYRLALACDLGEADALEIASGCASERARETA